MKKAYGVLSQGLRKKGKVREALHLGNFHEEVDRKKKRKPTSFTVKTARSYMAKAEGSCREGWENGDHPEKHALPLLSWKLKCGGIFGGDSICGYTENTTFKRDCVIIYGEPIVLPSDSAFLEMEGSPGQVNDWPICVNSVLLF